MELGNIIPNASNNPKTEPEAPTTIGALRNSFLYSITKRMEVCNALSAFPAINCDLNSEYMGCSAFTISGDENWIVPDSIKKSNFKMQKDGYRLAPG